MFEKQTAASHGLAAEANELQRLLAQFTLTEQLREQQARYGGAALGSHKRFVSHLVKVRTGLGIGRPSLNQLGYF